MDEGENLTSFNNFLSIQQEIAAILSNTDWNNTKPLGKLQAVWREIRTIRESQQDQIKELIKAWQTYEHDVAGKTTCGQDAAQILSQEEAVQGEVTQAKQSLSRAKEEYEDVQQKIETSKAELNQLVQEREVVEKQTTQSLPKARYDVNLYMNITNIRWQFDSEPEEVKGFVCNKNDVKPFSLNSKQVSKFFISNYLWDLIEEDW
ncbi:kinetochore protein Spc24-like [Mizuhopecten yessoensis]|uniref:Kinetochore protein Spc24 n=1 Tax=Mizuhopecten yessoensis TaxID=6573 RepID=A0A210R4H3_MIZYE|nr:kinetochore protein Spc24-like [Mizuhopecten yessoensis]OWF55909.1 Kinetochore protein Spc24 [Mizuhopecten yessoensis]